MNKDLEVEINLDNLEDVRFEGSKYVLTSPRSLQACSRLHLKPVELLYKSLTEFQEELLPQDIPLRTLYALFNRREQDRQTKLRLCREERNRIISADYQGAVSRSNEPVLSSVSRKVHEIVGQRESVVPRTAAASASCDFKQLVLEKSQCRRRPQSADRGTNLPKKSVSLALKKSSRLRSSSVPLISEQLPAKDQKILTLMLERRQSEQRELELNQRVHRQWEQERQQENLVKQTFEDKRRQLLTNSRQQAQRKNLLIKSQHIGSSQDLTVDSSIFQTGSAIQRKNMQLHHDHLKTLFRNEQKQEQFRTRHRALQSQQDENHAWQKSSLEHKHKKADKNLARILSTRNQKLEQQHREEQAKLVRAHKIQTQLEAEVDTYKYHQLQQELEKERKALEVVKESLYNKSLQVHNNIKVKQLEQQRNLSRLQQDEDQYRKSLKRSLGEKEEKMEMLKNKKEQDQARCRAILQTSEILRENIKRQYELNKFNRVLAEAEMYEKLYKKTGPQVKHKPLVYDSSSVQGS